MRHDQASSLRIAVIAPLAWRTPPRHYGPWELFASLLTVRGAIIATPRSSGRGIYPLRVPWMVVPRGLSDVDPGSRTGKGSTS